METRRRELIKALLPQLMEQIDCNIMLISELKASRAIGRADECHLDTFSNALERSYELLKIMCTRKDGYKLLVEGLRKSRQTEALTTLQEPLHYESTHVEADGVTMSQFAQMKISEAKSKVSILTTFKKIPFQTKEATELFTGRRKELDALLKNLLPDGGTASITGIGGVGKTELAKMFLQNLNEAAYENIFKQIVWVNCESAFTASTDFTNTAKDYLEVPIIGSSNQQRDMLSIINDVYDKLEKSKSLVVLDNIEIREVLQMCMSKTSSKISKLSILTTSQNSVLKIGTHISLDGLEINEAVEFVKKGLDLSVSISEEFENGISELVLRLEGFPLAISQAIGYIKEKMEMNPSYKPQEYVGDLDRIPERLLDGEFFIDISSQGKTVYKTIALALKKIGTCKSAGSLASNILSKVAFMSPEKIPSCLFLELAQGDTDAVEGALVLIRRFSIIKYSPVGKSGELYFSIHRLVQDVLRIRVAQQNRTESILHSLMTSLSLSLNLDFDIIYHALEAWKHAAKIPFLVKEFSTFPDRLASQMYNAGQISNAVDFAASSLKVLKRILSTKENASTIFWLQALRGYFLGNVGKFKSSLENLEATLFEAKGYLRKDHWIFHKVRFFIASVYFENGQFDEATLICDELHNDFKLGYIISLRVIHDIGFLQTKLRRFENALEAVNFILSNLHLVSEIDREKIEQDTRRLLASIHGQMGNYDEAIYLYSAILHIHLKKEKIKGLIHDGWLIFNEMGTYQYYAGRFEEAHDSYQKALNEMSGQNDKNCLWILETKCNIASLMLARNMVDEALPFSLEVYKQIKNLVEEKYYLAFASLGNIGVAFSKIGRHQDAVSIFAQLFENQSFVTQCSDEARFEKFHLAHSLDEIGSFEKAIEILNELRLKCLEYPNYKLHTLEHVDSALKRLNDKVRIADK